MFACLLNGGKIYLIRTADNGIMFPLEANWRGVATICLTIIKRIIGLFNTRFVYNDNVYLYIYVCIELRTQAMISYDKFRFISFFDTRFIKNFYTNERTD